MRKWRAPAAGSVQEERGSGSPRAPASASLKPTPNPTPAALFPQTHCPLYPNPLQTRRPAAPFPKPQPKPADPFPHRPLSPNPNSQPPNPNSPTPHPHQDLPDDYVCPICGATKSRFESRVKVVAGFAENQQYGFGTNSMTGNQKLLIIYGTLLLFVLLFLSGYALE